MDITRETTVKDILEAQPGAIKIFEKHGVDVEAQCDETVRDVPLSICEGMCHVDDLDALIADLQTYFNAPS